MALGYLELFLVFPEPFFLLDFTTIRRGFMKSQEDSTGKPEDGEQIIRFSD
jgi:hypothetical protein